MEEMLGPSLVLLQVPGAVVTDFDLAHPLGVLDPELGRVRAPKEPVSAKETAHTEGEKAGKKLP